MSATPMNLRRTCSVSIVLSEYAGRCRSSNPERQAELLPSISKVHQRIRKQAGNALFSLEGSYFRRIPKNMRSFELSSGVFSTVVFMTLTGTSEVEDGAVEAGDASKEPEEADAIAI